MASHLVDDQWQVVAVSPQTGDVRCLTRSSSAKRMPVVSADRCAVVYRDIEGRLWRVPLAGRKEHLVLTGQVITDFDIVGGRMVVSKMRPAPVSNSDIWLVEGGRITTCLADDVAREEEMAISPDGTTMVYSYRPSSPLQSLRLYEFSSGKRTTLTGKERRATCPCWSPDGKRIAFASNVAGGFDIYVLDIRTLERHRLTSHPAFDSSPAWSPDGRQIAFVSERSGKLQIWMMNSNGSAKRCLTPKASQFRELTWR